MRSVVAATALLVVVAMAGCAPSGAAREGDDKPVVLTAFYPLQWAAKSVAGEAAGITSLTEPGVEPHDLELSARSVASVSEADLVVYLGGFQPAVDEAVRQEARDRSYDVAADAELDLTFTPIEDGRQLTDEAGAVDPHFWLDPTRLAAVVDGIAKRLRQVAPTNGDTYTTNAAATKARLQTLDAEFRQGLARCAGTDLVTSHNAFGYLANRYGLRQVGITGPSPQGEPKPADLAAVASFVESRGVRTIYSETLISVDVAQTVARETGAAVDVLDPLEGITSESRGDDYVEVMRSNLASLKKGLRCA